MTLSRRLGNKEQDDELRRRFADKASTLLRQADVIRHMLLYGRVPLENTPQA